MAAPVLLIDTNSLFFRAFHALPPMNTREGIPTSAVYGFSVLLLKLLREEAPLGIAFARDAPARTFRHIEYQGYKAQRPSVPTPLGEQFVWLDRLLGALALPSYAVPGFEADDVLATLAREIHTEDRPVRIVTGDRDLFQTIRPGVDVLFIGARQQKPVVYDVAAVEARFGVKPERMPSLMALVGDTSDNLPGVPGIGPRTAAKLLGASGDVRSVLADLDAIKSATVREALRNAAEQVIRNERLARLRDEVPLPDGPRYGAPTAAAFEQVRALFVELEFNSLLARLPKP